MQVETLRVQLSNLQNSHAQELATEQAYWESQKETAENGFKALETLTIEAIPGAVAALPSKLGAELAEYQTYAERVKAVLSTIPGVPAAPAPTKTATGHDKANPRYAYATGVYLPGRNPRVATVGEVPETILPDQYIARLGRLVAPYIVEGMAAIMPRLQGFTMPTAAAGGETLSGYLYGKD